MGHVPGGLVGGGLGGLAAGELAALFRQMPASPKPVRQLNIAMQQDCENNRRAGCICLSLSASSADAASCCPGHLQ